MALRTFEHDNRVRNANHQNQRQQRHYYTKQPKKTTEPPDIQSGRQAARHMLFYTHLFCWTPTKSKTIPKAFFNRIILIGSKVIECCCHFLFLVQHQFSSHFDEESQCEFSMSHIIQNIQLHYTYILDSVSSFTTYHIIEVERHSIFTHPTFNHPFLDFVRFIWLFIYSHFFLMHIYLICNLQFVLCVSSAFNNIKYSIHTYASS